MTMKLFFRTSLILFFLSASVVHASDVIMATSEDLKEFDNLISKEKPALQKDLPPPQDANATAPPKKFKKPDPRKNFEGHPQNGQPGPNDRPPGQRPPQTGQPPPPGQDNRPPPGSPGGPPPPHP
jgi:hypothetical protein